MTSGVMPRNPRGALGDFGSSAEEDVSQNIAEETYLLTWLDPDCNIRYHIERYANNVMANPHPRSTGSCNVHTFIESAKSLKLQQKARPHNSILPRVGQAQFERGREVVGDIQMRKYPISGTQR